MGDLPSGGDASGTGLEETFEVFYGKYFRRLVAEATAMGVDPQTARDAAQHACSQVLKYWDGISHPRAYARTVLARYIRDQQKWWRRFGPVAEFDIVLPGNCPVDERMKVLDILAALNQLPRRQHQVMVLLGPCELSVRETAEALGVSDQSVYNAACEARKKLRLTLSLRPGPIAAGEGLHNLQMALREDPLMVLIGDAVDWLYRGIRAQLRTEGSGGDR
ncbi:sigma-70 family RNA polymerase sigma factor [Streptomyces bottropensis]|uniref:sigma-70 family RNA polymerase sigma factor n=1 Tax=Streptomyces bottropensis TaxID=42235 RepID=UPI0037AC56EF